MQMRVKLPSGQTIDVFDFCSAIAHAIRPVERLEGIDCIVGGLIGVPSVQEEGDRLQIPPAVAKMADAAIAAVSFTPNTTEESGLAEREFSSQPFPIRNGDVEFPVELTDDDRRWLETLLPKLPLLRHPISDEQAENFLTAYRGLKARKAWEPILITAAEIKRRKVEQDDLFVLHRNALERMFEKGELIAFDRKHHHVPALTVRSLISRSTAIAYLERNGLAEYNEHQLSPEERREAIVAYWKQLKSQRVKNYTKLTADKFDVSDSLVRRFVREVDPETAPKKTSPSRPFQKPKPKRK
ncbi:hypothetical protein NDK50_00895 [Paraburkholderia bryophila]|uniref:hypothetical protein n=1 Tax=Paraburkholderia bryophila TaxID=420952 RepID=UPI00234BEED2|nr:hypothetical protein [Paraburkholderia bryophila]WCM20070.1 hypothetical protein NDK50_00895 [Paraburkholderia bryophila]